MTSHISRRTKSGDWLVSTRRLLQDLIDTHMISLEGNTHFENNKWCSIKSKNQKEATLNATGNDNTFLHFCFYCKKQHVTRLNNFEKKMQRGFCLRKQDCFFAIKGIFVNRKKLINNIIIITNGFWTNKQSVISLINDVP